MRASYFWCDVTKTQEGCGGCLCHVKNQGVDVAVHMDMVRVLAPLLAHTLAIDLIFLEFCVVFGAISGAKSLISAQVTGRSPVGSDGDFFALAGDASSIKLEILPGDHLDGAIPHFWACFHGLFVSSSVGKWMR